MRQFFSKKLHNLADLLSVRGSSPQSAFPAQVRRTLEEKLVKSGEIPVAIIAVALTDKGIHSLEVSAVDAPADYDVALAILANSIQDSLKDVAAVLGAVPQGAAPASEAASGIAG